MVAVERERADYTDATARSFGVDTSTLHQQFSQLYFARLAKLRKPVLEAARRKWGELAKSPVKTLDVDLDVPCVLVGMLYKDMKRKPNIIDELNRDVFAEAPEGVDDGKYCGEGDALLLEDDSGRLALTGEVLHGRTLVSGVVVAVSGVMRNGGEFEVEDLCLPGLPPQRPLPATAAADEEGDRFVALVSGLHFGHETQDMLPIEMMREYLCGLLGSGEDHATQARTVRLVVAGNATSASGRLAEPGKIVDPEVMKRLEKEEQRSLAQRVSLLDTFLTGLAASVPVDLMPGADDPCNFLLPQQPFHACMLPHARRLETLNLCTNPHACVVDGVSLLGSSGQPLDDMLRYLPSAERIEVLGESLRFRHLAPTAPDTLGCCPFTAADPFVVEDCPHIYFAANQPEYADALVEGEQGQRVRVVAVPDFGATRTLVLVNLRTLECRPVVFDGLDADGTPMEA